MKETRKILITTLIVLTAMQPVLQAASNLPTGGLPTGGIFTAGGGKISNTGNILTINQNSLKAIIDWNTFSIGAGASVNFKNGSGATLNRVTGTTPTAIFGQLLASGNVYLLNPEGILIGHGATIHTGGDFLASTLNLPNSSFLAGGSLQFTGHSQASVVNLGDLASNGGSIYLIGHSVSNSGSIATPNGTTGLAAGAQVLISDSSSNQTVAVQAAGGDVTNSGFISAAQAELKSNGGNIYALAGNTGGQIRATGTATQNGHVWLIATNGTANVAGTITAANAGGTGGDIETSGAHVLTSAATIRTGKNGNWLLDPNDLTINSSLAGTIETSLNGGTNVTEQTTATGTGGSGDILVDSPIIWATGADLTLSAYRNIALNAGIRNTGSGNLTLRADNASSGSGTITGSGLIDFSSSTGNVALLYNPAGGYATPTDYSANLGTANPSWAAPVNGSVSSQYTAYMLVNTAPDLENISNNPNGTYALGRDIDLAGVTNFTPVAGDAPNHNFFGIFDGMGHTVSNLTIPSLAGAIDVGFFQSVIGQVRNLTLSNVNITTNTDNETVGAMTAELQGTISNSSTSGVIHAGLMTNQLVDGVGGLVGSVGFFSTIQNSHSSVTIDAGANNNAIEGGALQAGGLAGSSLPAVNITNSYATGSVTTGGGAKAGGLIGDSEFSNITTSYASGAVTCGVTCIAGGLLGNSYSPVSTSYATGAVITGAGSVAGGLVGYTNVALTDTYARGAVTIVSGTGTESVGGLVGELDTGGTITKSYSSGHVGSVSSNAGGLVGTNNDVSNITFSYWDKQNSGFANTAVGNGDSTGITGLTTAQLQSGAMPTGFNTTNTVWVAPAGVYPYFGWQGPLVTISGTAYSGSSVIPSAGVGVISSGLPLGTFLTNSSGFYTLSEPQNMLDAGVLSYLTTNGVANTFSDGGGPGGFANMDLHVGGLSLLDASNTRLSGISAALANAIGGNTGNAFLFAIPGGQLSLSSGTNLSIASSAAAFAIDQPLTASGNILINSSGNLRIAPGDAITAGAGKDITLVSGGVFDNTAGAEALSTVGGRWLVYSQTPVHGTGGGLAENYIQYNATYGVTAPAAPGNGFLYTLAPVITGSLTGSVSKTYDGTTAATLSSGNFITTGMAKGDTINLTLPTGAYASSNAGTNIDVTTGLGIASAFHGTIPVYGYQLSDTSASADIGTINPATLTYTATAATQPFGSGNSVFTGTVSGFVAGQTLASATTGAAVFNSTTTSASAAGTYGILGSGLTANHGNYIFTQAGGNATALTIAAALTVTPPPTAPPPAVPPASNTTLTIDLNNVVITTGQTPAFSATYAGAPINGLNVSSILSGLTYQITPSLNGPGSYKITATGAAPSGYVLNFVAGTVTVIDDSPAVIPTLTSLFQPELPSLLLSEAGASSSNFLAPVNALGLFQIDVTSKAGNDFGSAFNGSGTPPSALSQSSFFSGTNDNSDRFAAGAKP